MQNKDNWVWPDDYIRRGDGIILLPVPRMDYDIAKDAYFRTKDNGLLNYIFEGDISQDRFMDYYNEKNGNYTVLLFVDNQFSGYAWLNNLHGKRAFLHYCFFKEIWGIRTLDSARRIIDYWLHIPNGNEYLLDVLVGVTPVTNRKAIKFIKAVGSTIIGSIPFMTPDGDGVISYTVRKNG